MSENEAVLPDADITAALDEWCMNAEDGDERRLASSVRARFSALTAENERLKTVAKSAANGIQLAIATEDGLDGNEGSDILAALKGCGIEPDPMHEEGCTASVRFDQHIDGTVWKYACVETCAYYKPLSPSPDPVADR